MIEVARPQSTIVRERGRALIVQAWAAAAAIHHLYHHRHCESERPRSSCRWVIWASRSPHRQGKSRPQSTWWSNRLVAVTERQKGLEARSCARYVSP